MCAVNNRRLHEEDLSDLLKVGGHLTEQMIPVQIEVEGFLRRMYLETFSIVKVLSGNEKL